MYILIDKDKRIVDIRQTIPGYYSDNLTLCQVEFVPEKYDYLIAKNVHLVEEKLDDKIISSYYTCELIAKFRPTLSQEQLNKLKEEKYNARVTQLIRLKYSADAVEALLANYAEDKEKYQAEFAAFTAYRKQCKEQAHNEIYGG